MSFTRILFEEAAPLLDKIHAHPFNKELGQGLLAQEKFQFYLKQDSLYLTDFGRALGLVGARLKRPEEVLLFFKFAEGAIEAERSLHRYYLQFYGCKLDVGQAPGCFAYTQFLLATSALGSVEEAVAALLPCFWIYREVGRQIAANTSEDNPYQKWIETYAGEEFNDSVERAISVLDQMALDASGSQKMAMRASFLKSCELEWVFWQSAYELEKWPL